MAEPGLGLAWRLARRELRGGIGGFRIFLACLAIGVAAIAAVGCVSAAMVGGLDAGARDLLGGDVEFRVPQRSLPPEQIAWLEAHGTVSTVRLLRAMVRREDGDARTLVELKAVDGAYPLSGSLTLEPAMPLAQALETRDGVAGAAVDPLVLERLHAKLGDRVALGTASVELRAVVKKEPDTTASLFSLGPRVMVSMAALAATGLDQPGTLSNAAYRVMVPPGGDAAALIAAANAAFPTAGWQVRDLAHASPGVEDFVDRTGQFLTLVGLTALLVGGVGVGNATASYLAGRAEVIAVLKCVGAPARLIYAVYLLQLAVLASAGIVAGLVAGASAPWLVQALGGDLLPVPLQLGFHPGPLALAAAFGYATAFLFSLWPLARARLVAPAGLFRGAILPRPTVVPFADRLVALLVATGLGALAVLSAGDRRLAGWFILAALVTLALFRVLGLLAMVAARAAGRPRRPWLRLALANLYRPGAATPSVVLSLGLGLTVLVAVSLVEASLTEEVEGRLAEAAPSFFFIDIQPDEAVPFAALVQQSPGVSDFTSVPNLRGRIARIKDVPAAQANVDPDRRQLVDSERGLTYADAVPRGSRIVAGEWWPKDYAGPPLVSLDQGLAEGLHLKLGDSISVDIAGREITGTLANLRQIDWTSLGINFFMVFSPGVLDGAPQTRIATVRVDTPAHEEALSKAVGDRFPNVSAVRVRDELERVRTLLAGLSALVEATAAISIASGLLVLSGAVAAGHRRRVYDAVVLKVLGATRPMLLRGYLIEYGALGAATALLAVVLGTVAAWLVVVKVMRADWSFAAGPVALTVLGGIGLTLLVALGGTWRALGARAVVQLRQD